jgi:hypothetical protein
MGTLMYREQGRESCRFRLKKFFTLFSNAEQKSGGSELEPLNPRCLNERLIIRQGGSMRITTTPFLTARVKVQNAK